MRTPPARGVDLVRWSTLDPARPCGVLSDRTDDLLVLNPVAAATV
jgi:hypothetical protein